jgi:hypothetical protein
MTANFAFFPQLITEIRWEIWQLALPDSFRKALYPYRKGCWVIEEMGLEPDPNGEDLEMRFDFSFLEPLRIRLPLYDVNREARDVVLKHMKTHKLVSGRDSSTSAFHYLRPFDARTDTMFLQSSDISSFVGETTERIHEPDMVERYVSINYPILERVAVTLGGFESLMDGWLEELFDFTGSITSLYVVDVAGNSRVNLDHVEDASIFSSLILDDAHYARLAWSKSRRQWEASGDSETSSQMRNILANICTSGSRTSDYDLEIQLVHLRSPS